MARTDLVLIAGTLRDSKSGEPLPGTDIVSRHGVRHHNRSRGRFIGEHAARRIHAHRLDVRRQTQAAPDCSPGHDRRLRYGGVTSRKTRLSLDRGRLARLRSAAEIADAQRRAQRLSDRGRLARLCTSDAAKSP